MNVRRPADMVTFGSDDILPEFLLARIAEDEYDARAARSGPWNTSADTYEASVWSGGSQGYYGDLDAVAIAHTSWENDETSAASFAHIARHDPARVLAECEAKRSIVGLHPLDPIVVHSWGTTGGGCNLCEHDCNSGGGTWGDRPCDTLRALALPYADHPDYREDWR